MVGVHGGRVGQEGWAGGGGVGVGQPGDGRHGDLDGDLDGGGGRDGGDGGRRLLETRGQSLEEGLLLDEPRLGAGLGAVLGAVREAVREAVLGLGPWWGWLWRLRRHVGVWHTQQIHIPIYLAKPNTVQS